MTYDELEQTFQAQAGLQTLDATDKFFFLSSLNLHAKDAWHRAKWPELLSVTEHSVSSSGGFTNITSSITGDVLAVYDKNPWVDISANTINYTLMGDKIALQPRYPNSSVFILEKTAFVPYSDSSTNIPEFLEAYLASAILASFFRGDGQYDKAGIEEQRAEEFLLRQIDRVERTQNQNAPLVGTYYTNSQSRQIFQTT
jgi:hypothetical protein